MNCAMFFGLEEARNGTEKAVVVKKPSHNNLTLNNKRLIAWTWHSSQLVTAAMQYFSALEVILCVKRTPNFFRLFVDRQKISQRTMGQPKVAQRITKKQKKKRKKHQLTNWRRNTHRKCAKKTRKEK